MTAWTVWQPETPPLSVPRWEYWRTYRHTSNLPQLSEYHVHSGIGRTGNLHLCLYRCIDRFLMVQRLSGTSIHGRHRQPDYRWYHCRICHYHPQELLIPILCGVFLVENLSVILQRFYYKIGKRKGSKTAVVQTNSDTRSFPYFDESGRTGMYGEVHEARPAVSRIKDYRPFLDCNDCTGSDNDYYIKNTMRTNRLPNAGYL